MNPYRQQFEEIVSTALSGYRERVVAFLRDLLGRSLPPEVRVLWFEIQSSTRTFPVRVFGMGGRAVNDACVVDPEAGTFTPMLNEKVVAEDEGKYVSYDVIDEYDNDVPVGSYEYAAHLIAGFLRGCYLEAGGQQHPLCAYASHHDSGEALDLKSGEWVGKQAIHDGHA